MPQEARQESSSGRASWILRFLGMFRRMEFARGDWDSFNRDCAIMLGAGVLPDRRKGDGSKD